MTEIDEWFYADAAREVADRTVIAGLMAKAFSEADGDERKAAAKYISYRAKQLFDEHDRAVQQQADAQRLAKDRAKALSQIPDFNGEVSVTCSVCDHDKARRMPRGSWPVALLLTCAGVLPGILYAFLAHGYVNKCSKCGTILHENS